MCSQPQIAEVPVKGRLIFSRRFRDAGHHHVAAIARVTGHKEAPRAARGLLRCGAFAGHAVPATASMTMTAHETFRVSISILISLQHEMLAEHYSAMCKQF